MEILVFKTNACLHRVHEIDKCLYTIKGISTWDFDLEDADKILRVKTANVTATEIEMTLHRAGYECVELPD